VASNADPLVASYNDFDRDPWLLGVKNGVVNLRNGDLRPGRPEDFITKCAPVEYRGIHEPRPVWENFLLTALDGKTEIIRYLQKFLGYSITGLRILRMFFFWHGPRGQNGKGTIMDILLSVLGSYAGILPTEYLMVQRNTRSAEGPSPTTMSMMGKRIIFAEETDEDHRIAAGKVKQITGGGRLVGRSPNDRHPTEFDPCHHLILLSNLEAMAPAYDNAFWIRLRKIVFPYTFVDKPTQDWERLADRNLGEKLQAEASGIIGWIVQGCLRWELEGMQEPAEVIKAVEDYRRREDRLEDFLDECCTLNPDAEENATALYTVFKKWWKSRVTPKPPSQRKFGDWMTLRFHKESGDLGRKFYYGVRLNVPHFSEDE
jgi:putative DNA primase/helicase